MAPKRKNEDNRSPERLKKRARPGVPKPAGPRAKKATGPGAKTDANTETISPTLRNFVVALEAPEEPEFVGAGNDMRLCIGFEATPDLQNTSSQKYTVTETKIWVAKPQGQTLTYYQLKPGSDTDKIRFASKGKFVAFFKHGSFKARGKIQVSSNTRQLLNKAYTLALYERKNGLPLTHTLDMPDLEYDEYLDDWDPKIHDVVTEEKVVDTVADEFEALAGAVVLSGEKAKKTVSDFDVYWAYRTDRNPKATNYKRLGPAIERLFGYAAPLQIWHEAKKWANREDHGDPFRSPMVRFSRIFVGERYMHSDYDVPLNEEIGRLHEARKRFPVTVGAKIGHLLAQARPAEDEDSLEITHFSMWGSTVPLKSGGLLQKILTASWTSKQKWRLCEGAEATVLPKYEDYTAAIEHGMTGLAISGKEVAAKRGSGGSSSG